MNKLAIKAWDDLQDRVPEHALVADVDLHRDKRKLLRQYLSTRIIKLETFSGDF